MAASDKILKTSQDAIITALPDEIVGNILSQCTTPTFLQLTRARKDPFFRVANSNRKLLLHHLANLPGDKDVITALNGDNGKLFLLLRQRAANNLYGINFTANMTEYLNRSADLNLSGCSISGLDADYVRMALCFKGANDIRQYTSSCNIKEKIKQPAGGKLLKLGQHGRVVSCLYQFWNEIEDEDLLYEADYESDSDSESEPDQEVLAFNPFPPSANAQLLEHCRRDKKAKQCEPVSSSKYTKPEQSWYHYRITHFDVYTMEDSISYSIKPVIGYIPRDFVVQNTQHCAVLWDEDTEDGRPTENAKVINYKSTVDSDRFEAIPYEEMVVWPKTKDTPKRDSESDSDDPPERLPERIAFFKDGRRLKLYEAGGVVPYEVLSTSSSRQDPFTYASTNRIGFNDLTAHVDTPFYGSHGKFYDEAYQEKYCFMTWLGLGICTLNAGNEEAEQRVLCILRAQSRSYPDDCDHQVSFSRMAHVGAGNATVVARLWGWEEMHTNLTGAETVSVSPYGTRIAISMWNKVYVYALNPRILCAETVVESDEDEKAKSRRKKKRKFDTPWETRHSDYYRRKKDPRMENWHIAEIRPVVLDLEGAVAHKMSWSPAKGKPDDVFPDWRNQKATKLKSESDTTEDEADVEGGPSSSASETASEATVINTNHDAANIDVDEVVPVDESEHNEGPSDISEISTSTDTSFVSEAAAEAVSIQEAAGQSASQNAMTLVENKSQHPAEVVSSAGLPLTAPEEIATVQETEGVVQAVTATPPLQTLASTLSHTPAPQLTLTNSPEQAAKTLPRKEKAVELKLENTKPQSLYSISPSKVLLHQPLLSTTKEGYKAKKTVAQMLESGSNSSCLSTDATGSPLSTLPSAMISKEEFNEPHVEDVQKDNSNAAPTATKDEVPEEAEKKPEEAVSSENSSKDSVETATLEISKIVVTEITEDAAEEKTQPHRRISEDELVILTDRGVQIWNLGAAAKGLRKKLALPMEESLCGRLPLRKGKSREPVEDE